MDAARYSGWGAGPCRFFVQGVDESRLSGRRSELDCYMWVEV